MSERWPRKPPKDAYCDAMVGTTSCPVDGMPQVVRCKAPAVETCKTNSLSGMESWLCLEHAEDFASRGIVTRNPKLFAALASSEAPSGSDHDSR